MQKYAAHVVTVSVVVPMIMVDMRMVVQIRSMHWCMSREVLIDAELVARRHRREETLEISRGFGCERSIWAVQARFVYMSHREAVVEP